MGKGVKHDPIHEEYEGSDRGGSDRLELTRVEQELAKQNFGFYDKQRQGWVERFELPMILNGIFAF